MRRLRAERSERGDEYRRALLAKKAELVPSLGAKFRHLASSGRVAEEDQAAVSHDEFISLSIGSLDYEQLTLVEEALERIGTGEFGICQNCGERIFANRLKAIPWARYCVGCQNRIGAAEGGSVPRGAPTRSD